MSLNYDTIKHMNLFTPDALANEYIEQYAYEHGQKKAIKIIRKVEDSVKVKHYLNSIVHDTLKPSAKGLETLMNTINYFMFSKEETLCLGGLATFVLWRDRFMSKERVSDVLEQEKIDHLLTPICSELIYNCSVNKINQSDNFFLRFQKRIIRIVREEEINDIWNSNKEIKSETVPGNVPEIINKKIDILQKYLKNLQTTNQISYLDMILMKSELDELIDNLYQESIKGFDLPF